MDYFSHIPKEIVIKILSFLLAKDLCSVSLVNKNLWSFTQDDYVWRSICNYQFPADYLSSEELKIIAEEGSNSSEQQANKMDGKKLYKRLSRHINFIAKERGVIWLDCQQGGGSYHHWKTLQDSQSEFGKIVSLNHVWWFHVSSTLKAVLPGIYDVIWRLKVGSGYRLDDLNFSATVIEKTEGEDEDEGTTIHEYNHTSQPSTFSTIAEKNVWVEYCLPYKLVIPEREVIGGKLIYHDVHLKILNHEGSSKHGLSIDYVRLREHEESRVYEELTESSTREVFKDTVSTRFQKIINFFRDP